jgi:adenosylhomocysteine nucleosidase
MNAERGTRNAESVTGKYLVCFALKEEATTFQSLVAKRNDVSILITGIGRDNAGKSVCGFLQHNSPQQVFTCGFAGGLDPQLKIGEVVFLTVDWMLDKALVEAGARPASFYCAARVATTAAEKAELRRTTSADAVEMESEVIQGICRERNIPCATVRAISDAANEDMPLNFNQLSNPDQSLNYGKLAWAITKSPGRIPALMRLQRNCRFAAERLAEVLKRVIELNLPTPER